MTRVLDVLALPRGNLSRTRQLHDAFVTGLEAGSSNVSRVELEVGKDPDQLPEFDEWDISAKFEMANGDGNLTAEQAERWDRLARVTDQLHQAQLVVISCPMWNFSIPWQLKRWVDAVVQGRLTFEMVGGQYRGLLGGREAVLLVTRDGAYGAGSPYASADFQLPYLRQVLGFMGITTIHEVVAEGLMMQGPEEGVRILQASLQKARELGQALGQRIH
jgi:FMN-dependent NADH-azoreductase